MEYKKSFLLYKYITSTIVKKQYKRLQRVVHKKENQKFFTWNQYVKNTPVRTYKNKK